MVLVWVRMRGETPGASWVVEFRWSAERTVLNFKDKRPVTLQTSRLRAERERQRKIDVGFRKSKNRHLRQNGFSREQF